MGEFHPIGSGHGRREWAANTLVGLKSVHAMSLNATALEILAAWWVKVMTVAKPPSVDLLRREAWAPTTKIIFQ